MARRSMTNEHKGLPALASFPFFPFSSILQHLTSCVVAHRKKNCIKIKANINSSYRPKTFKCIHPFPATAFP